MNCKNNCGMPIRRREPRDGVSPLDPNFMDLRDRDYEWVHDYGPDVAGNPVCDMILIAEPSPDGH